MLRVYGHYQYFIFFRAGSVFINTSESDVCRRQLLTYVYGYVYLTSSLKHEKVVRFIIIDWVFFKHVINIGWREQVEAISTMPVNHISEFKLYNKIIWQYHIKPTIHWL